MANEFAEAREGLAAMLRQIDGLNVHSYVAPRLALTELSRGEDYPMAIVRPDYREGADIGLSGAFTVEALLAGGSPRDAFIMLEAFLEPHGDLSIEAAVVSADDTWGGKVGSSRLIRVDNIGARLSCADDAVIVGAEFHFGFEGR